MSLTVGTQHFNSLRESKHVNFFQTITSAEKVVQVYISKRNTEMIDRLRQLSNPRMETAKISDCQTKGYACLMGELFCSLTCSTEMHMCKITTTLTWDKVLVQLV